jgi:hypothetical protein
MLLILSSGNYNFERNASQTDSATELGAANAGSAEFCRLSAEESHFINQNFKTSFR